MDGFAQDVRYALRLIRRKRGYAAIVILTQGLGIGAITAVFSIVDAVLLRPLPYRDPSRLVAGRRRWFCRFGGCGDSGAAGGSDRSDDGASERVIDPSVRGIYPRLAGLRKYQRILAIASSSLVTRSFGRSR